MIVCRIIDLRYPLMHMQLLTARDGSTGPISPCTPSSLTVEFAPPLNEKIAALNWGIYSPGALGQKGKKML